MSNQITAYNLSNDDELGFFGDSPLICPEWAVVYGYAEEKNLLSKAFRIIQDHPDELVAKLKENFPLVYGRQSVGCGDWAARCAMPEEPSLRELPN